MYKVATDIQADGQSITVETGSAFINSLNEPAHATHASNNAELLLAK
jgi:hypothetical protein